MLRLLAQPSTEFDILLPDSGLGSASLAISIDLIVQVLKRQPATRIIVVTMHNEPDIVNAALRSVHQVMSQGPLNRRITEAIAHAHQGRGFSIPTWWK
ncbi:MAG: hypothetical protein IPN53_24065 [Comamonadaceae bacterium]|nr:hypothetical protein [Comamonadaceae bacterium]